MAVLTPELQSKIQEFRSQVYPIYNSQEFTDEIGYLKGRWLDEKGYEDFEQYKARIIELFKKVKYDKISINKNFRIVLTKENINIELKVTTRTISFGIFLTK